VFGCSIVKGNYDTILIERVILHFCVQFVLFVEAALRLMPAPDGNFFSVELLRHEFLLFVFLSSLILESERPERL
jgi:hypothetical protein